MSSSKKSNIKTLKGMRDIFAPEVQTWQAMELQLHDLMQQFAYSEIRTPILESQELYRRGTGDTSDIVQKELYEFEDKNGEWISLRPEGTPSVVRSLIQNSLLEEGRTQKVYYMGPMFRRERPQKGRFRQFHQFGMECIGSYDALMDVEIILAATEICKRFGVKETKIKLNTLGDVESREKHRQALLSYLEQHKHNLDQTSQERMQTNPLRLFDSKVPQTQEIMKEAPVLMDYLLDVDAQHFENVKKHLKALNIEFEVDPYMVRGLDYYTHTVFEVVSSDLGSQSAICGGGRYNHLVEEFGGKSVPAVGFAMGLERLLMLARGLKGKDSKKISIFPLVDAAKSQSMMCAKRIRDHAAEISMSVEVLLVSDKTKLKAALRLADKNASDLALIFGTQELEAGHILVKHLKEGTQQECSIESLLEQLEKENEIK